MSLSRGRLARIEARAKSATDGPWEAHEEDGGVLPEWAVWMPDAGHDGAMVVGKADAEFIAHARTDVPDLLAEVKRLRAGIGEAASDLHVLAHTTACTGSMCDGCQAGRIHERDMADAHATARARDARVEESFEERAERYGLDWDVVAHLMSEQPTCVLTFEEALAEHDVAVAAKAWSEAVAAAAWAMDRGPDPLRYVAETNPYKREAGESGADA